MQRLSKLAEERKRSRLTQEELARAAQINRVSLARLETGEARAKPETQKKLARVLKVDPKALV